MTKQDFDDVVKKIWGSVGAAVPTPSRAASVDKTRFATNQIKHLRPYVVVLLVSPVVILLLGYNVILHRTH